jgi:hypothetical protein
MNLNWEYSSKLLDQAELLMQDFVEFQKTANLN